MSRRSPMGMSRRSLIKTAALAAVAPLLARPANVLAAASATSPAAADSLPPSRPAGVPVGRPGEFDFLAGEWRIAHRWRKSAQEQEWLEFNGEATCWTILGGIGSVEELRIPVRDFHGMGLRLLDVEQKVWSDFWVNQKSGVLVSPGTYGGFVDGVGTFESEDAEGNPPMKARGVWDRITGRSHRWSQSVSTDGGRTWQDTWVMDWRKA